LMSTIRLRIDDFLSLWDPFVHNNGVIPITHPGS
jgi:hypothetical protein